MPACKYFERAFGFVLCLMKVRLISTVLLFGVLVWKSINDRNAARLQHNDQAHPPPEAERGTSEAVGGRVQRLVLSQLLRFAQVVFC